MLQLVKIRWLQLQYPLNPLHNLCDKIHHLVDGSFQKTYLPSEFADLEAGVFGDLRTTAEEKVLRFM